MKRLSTLLIICSIVFFEANSQVSITSGGTPVVIDFTGWTGSGFDNPPGAGQLSSLNWDLDGFNTAYTYGNTNTGGDYARGVTLGGVTTGGVYALDDVARNDTAIWIQPAGSDFTPGSLTLVMQNNTGSDIVSLSIAYDVLNLNDQPRANSFNFSYSTDNSTYFDVPSLDFTSPDTSDGMLTVSAMAALISPITVPNGGKLYLRWEGSDVSGSESRDEFGLDNIVVTASTGTAEPTVSFGKVSSTVSEDTGSFQIEVTIDIPSPNPTSVTLAIDGSSTAQFGPDFTGSPITITFPANTTASQYVTINIVNDTIAESFEQAILNLTNPTNNASILFGTHTINILDDDNIIFDFVPASMSASESGISVVAEISIDNPHMRTTSVDVVLSSLSTATSGPDFSYTNTTLTFPGNNSANQTVTITINDDSEFEAYETVVLALTNATNNALYDDSLFVGTILDDETPPSGPCENLYFSEYIEGFSFNKALEIYNPTGNTVDLAGYSIRRYTNGLSSPSQTLLLSGMLATGDVVVVAHPLADSAILVESDIQSTVTNYNGNDAVGLYNHERIIDVIGTIGEDSLWIVDSGTTENHVLVRKPDVNSGNTDWPSSSASEWIVYSANTLDKIGFHMADACAPVCPVPTSVNTIITGPKKAILDWDDMPGAMGYLVRGRQIGAGGLVELLISNPTSQLMVTGLAEGQSFWWQVKTICSSDGTVSSNFSEKDTFTLCGHPTTFQTTNITTNSAKLQWSAVSNAIKYEVLGKEASAPSSQIVTIAVNAPTTQLTATGLLPDKTYYWTARSICNVAGTIISDIGPVQVFMTLTNAPEKTVITVGEAEVYPNPASELITVNVPQEFGEFDVSLFDISGKQVYHLENNVSETVNINVVDVNSGVYFLEINGIKNFRSRIIIQ